MHSLFLIDQSAFRNFSISGNKLGMQVHLEYIIHVVPGELLGHTKFKGEPIESKSVTYR